MVPSLFAISLLAIRGGDMFAARLRLRSERPIIR
jgi:hypothetical protein